MTRATTDGTATLFFDDVLEVQIDDDVQRWSCEIWRDARGRFVAIVTTPAAAPDLGAGRRLVVDRAIASALRAACAGDCDLILEYWPGGALDPFWVLGHRPVWKVDRVDLAGAGVLVPLI